MDSVKDIVKVISVGVCCYGVRVCLGSLLVFSVYMPTDSADYLAEFAECLGEIAAIVEDCQTPSKPDPCVFNSVIKYETIPTRRRVEYTEEDYLCLKSSFNNTVEQYLSVPRRVVNETCKNGMVRSLEENVAECGLRVLSEYSYYPGSAAAVPREYCAGACRLLAAWHVSNATIENFEFLKDEPGFKKYFVKSDSERLI